MFGRPFRFIHASDLHLERTPRGLSAPPDHLRDLLVDAPYTAATRVFDAALAEEADFLILAGDLLHVRHAGPQGLVFLVEQFRRLAERGIGVFWAGGRVDRPDAWPTSVRLPDNVIVFPAGRVEEFIFRRAGVPLARLLGASHDGRSKIRAVEFPAEHTQLYSIGVVHGSADPDRLSHRAVHYWALGGRHERTTLSAAPHVVHYPGTPLGRFPDETGPHGCTLVQVDEQGRAHLTFLPTDPLRWQQERLAVGERTTADVLAGQLAEQTKGFLAAAPGVNLFISWTICGSGPLLAKLLRGGLGDELLSHLRTQFGHRAPAAWTVSLTAEGAAPAEELYEQETILGDFLRAVRRFETHAELPLDLEAYLSEPQLAGALGAAARLAEPGLRERVLREAAWLGSDLLSAGETPVEGVAAGGAP